MAKKKPEEEAVDGEVVYDFTAKHKIQVRLEDGGPKKKDGRRGVIVLEDEAAPESVVRWLKSPTCKKSERGTGGRRQCYLWIDDAMVPTVSVDVPDADADPDPDAPSVALAAQSADHAHQVHLAKLTRALEAAIDDARERHRAEIQGLRDLRDKEVDRCNRLIRESEERLAKALEREDLELAALGQRRSEAGQQRAAMAAQMVQDDQIFGLVRQTHGKRLLAQDKSILQEVADFVSNPGGAAIAMGIASKLGLPPEMILLLTGGGGTTTADNTAE